MVGDCWCCWDWIWWWVLLCGFDGVREERERSGQFILLNIDYVILF